MNRWRGLTNLDASLEYWSAVQTTLAQNGSLSSAAPLYEGPHFSGNRLVIPRGPGIPEDGEGYTDYSILDEGDCFSIRTSGRSRGNQHADSPESWFGTFDDAAKYFIASCVALPTRLRIKGEHLEIIGRRWMNLGLAPSWAEVAEPDPLGFEKSKTYFRTDNPQRYYITITPDTKTSFLLDLKWPELNSTFSEAIRGIEHIQIPTFSDD